MTSFAASARRLPLHHVTIRVPWHDGGWTGSVCARPLDNTNSLILPRIGDGWRRLAPIGADWRARARNCFAPPSGYSIRSSLPPEREKRSRTGHEHIALRVGRVLGKYKMAKYHCRQMTGRL